MKFRNYMHAFTKPTGISHLPEVESVVALPVPRDFCCSALNWRRIDACAFCCSSSWAFRATTAADSSAVEEACSTGSETSFDMEKGTGKAR